MSSQKDMILRTMNHGGTVTPINAIMWYGCLRLAARIKDLRNDGHDIVTVMVEGDNGKRWAEYHLRVGE